MIRTLAVCVLRFGLLLLIAAVVLSRAEAAPPGTRVLILVGPSTHPPGTHEVAAGARLIEYCLEHFENLPPIPADVITEWPADPATLDDVATVVFTGDRFPPEEMQDRLRIMTDLTKLMDRGCGLFCYHYATGLGAAHVPADGDHPLLDWMGGYFATRTPHHQSIAKIFESATIEPGTTPHPVLNGWKSFTLKDEPYINNYFGPNGPEPNVVTIATSLLPPDNPKRETVAWAVTRKDGGRGMGIVMPHFYKNWANEDLRRCILNGIVWTAHREVPAEGVKTTLPDLTTFAPASVEPQPRKPAK
jgi:type 1 glutamine amidotransferase